MNSLSRAAARGFIVAGVLALAVPAAAVDLEPGEWQDTETGTEDGKPFEARVTTDCMSAEEAKDPVKALAAMKDTGGQCSKFDVKESGKTVTLAMVCGDAKQMSIDIVASYTFLDRRNYTGTMKTTMTIAGQTSSSNTKVVSKWIGACKK